MNARTIAYWVTTLLFCLVVGYSGASHFPHAEEMVVAMSGLGYPLYFMTIIGFAKMLAAAAVLIPGRPLLKEWAYAGLTFNLLGATASHASSGDAFDHTIRPFIVLMIGVASYLLRPDSRRLPQTSSFAGEASATTPVG